MRKIDPIIGDGLRYTVPKLKWLPVLEQPAYRVSVDSDGCNLIELLAVLIGGSNQIEVAERLTARFGTIQKIARAHAKELEEIQGISKLTAIRVKAALSLGRKLLMPEDACPVINNPEDAAQILMPTLAHREQEYMIVIVLDSRNRVLDLVEVYHGSLDSALVRICEIFRPAIQRNAAAIMLAHNHPSNMPDSSPDDITITRTIVEAGKLLNINVLDHIIIGLSTWVSLRAQGVAFE